MGHTIHRYATPDREFFLIWSSVVDAPITYGMSREELVEHIREQYGRSGLDALPERIARAERAGTSSRIHASLDEETDFNRAGMDETRLTRDQIVAMYCLRTGDIRGTDPREDS